VFDKPLISKIIESRSKVFDEPHDCSQSPAGEAPGVGSDSTTVEGANNRSSPQHLKCGLSVLVYFVGDKTFIPE
jgi:hypothetical protein